MTIYSKTAWKDHIVDSGGAVVQQGTPLSAGNLLKLEEGLANATALTAGELGAATAHSGVLSHGGIRTAWSTPSAGEVLVPGAGVIVNGGYQIRIGVFQALIAGNLVTQKGLNAPANYDFNDFKLLDPPTEGTRDDFVFLEAWRDQTTQEWKSRIRTVEGVDFTSTPNTDGFTYPINTAKGAVAQAQGGNTEPLNYPIGNFYTDPIHKWGGFYGVNQRKGAQPVGKKVYLEDVGLFMAGEGDAASKSALKTYDGYVYAIPLFKVNRRNSGGYSANNPNGSREHFSPVWSRPGALDPGKTMQYSLTTQAFYDAVNVGDVYVHPTDAAQMYSWSVISKDGYPNVTVKSLGSGQISGGGATGYYRKSERPDGLFSNIIDERDITDLRHKTYLVAPSYEQLLIDGTDQILRGASQVERKKAMRKTYVGVRKTPLDANHVFYASFDGASMAEVGGVPSDSTAIKYVPAITGAGFKGDKSIYRDYPLTSSSNTVTVDYWYYYNVANENEYMTPVTLLNAAGLAIAQVFFYRNLAYPGAVPVRPGAWNHVRFIIKGLTVTVYINGAGGVVTELAVGNPTSLARIRVGSSAGLGNNTMNGIISDVSVSTVDRGAAFATLPADFIAGYADIMPTLSDQRRINSDAQTSQKSYASAKVKNQTQERSITVTKGAGTNTAAWEAGDKIKVKGIAGEIISGVIDSDTALATIRPNPTGSNYAGAPVTVYVDDVSKLSVGDKFTVPSIGNAVQTISAIDTIVKTITFDNPSGWVISNAITPATIYETTASTSSPVVRAIIAGTSTAVPGTWTALGTNEAEVTLGALPGGLVAQDIIIEYSLNMPAGQGSLYQVYTKTLGGEANGKKLIESTAAASPMLVDDFTGKIAGSLTVNPNRAYSYTGATPAAITALGTEFSQAEYDAIKNSDSTLKTVTTTVNGEKAQVNLVFDVIKSFEQKYGVIPGCFTVLEKVTWLRANMRVNFTPSALAYGTGPAGTTGAQMTVWTDTTFWGFQNSHISITPQSLQSVATSSRAIHTDGFVYVNIMASNASDGVTASTLYIDTATITFYPIARAGYDILVPENARRDAGLGGVLYVRRQSREVESLFPGNDEDNGISVIGDYVPTQEIATATLTGTQDVLLGMQGFVTTAGTNRAYDTGGTVQLANAISRVLGPGDDLNYKVDPQTLVSTAAYDRIAASGVLRYWYPDLPYGQGPSTALFSAGVPSWATNVAEFLIGMPALVILNGELLLLIRCRKRSGMSDIGMGGDGGSGFVRYYRLPSRPLIKI